MRLDPRVQPPDRRRRCARGTVWIVRCRCVTRHGWARWRAANSATRWPTTARWGRCCGSAFPGTLLLTVTATLLAWLMAVPLGIWNAANRGRWSDRITESQCFRFYCLIPDLLLAVILLVLAVETGWLPAGGMHSPGAGSLDARGAIPRHLAPHDHSRWPCWCWGCCRRWFVTYVRAVADAMDSPFALAARAHGIPRRRLLFPPYSARGAQSAGQPVRLLAGHAAQRLAAGGSAGGLARAWARSSWKRSWRAILPWCWAW